MVLQLNLTAPVLQPQPILPIGKYIEGTDDNDVLQGGLGDDAIEGKGGNDFIQGRQGNDWLFGGAGHDWILGDAGNDLLSGGDGNDRLEGGSGNDRIGGGNGNDRLYGNAGDDELSGGLGSDYMAGGTGNDTYWVYTTTDIVVEAANEGEDTVISAISYTLGDNLENLELLASTFNHGDDDSFIGGPQRRGIGNQLDNVIKGSAVNDLLDGKSGNDTLRGWAGNDTVVGGTGSDSLRGDWGDDVLIGYGGAGTLVSHGTGTGTFGTPVFHQPEIDTLNGWVGADTFVLANNQETFYTHSRSAYAIVEDFSRSDGDLIQLLEADKSAYTIDQSKDFGFGSTAADTAIYKDNDLVAILQDTTVFSLTTDVSYVFPIAPPH